MSCRITLNGFYQYDPTLFDGVILPNGFDREEIISNIMRNCGDLYPYHQMPDMLKHNITGWFARRSYDFEKMYDTLHADYSPVSNYDRTEVTTRTSSNSGSDTETMTLGKTSTAKYTGSDTTEMQVSAYNTEDYANRERETQNHGTTTTTTDSGSDSKVTSYGLSRSEREELRVYGNIGITTTQAMIEAEMELRSKYDLYNIITKMFEREFIVQVY